jgi:type IV pilus assembly protein PilO
MQTGSRIVAYVVLLLATLGASYYYMVKPMAEHNADLRSQTQKKLEKLSTLRTAAAGVQDLPAEIDKLRKAIAFFEGKLPEEKEMDKVLREVWQIAERNGLSTKSVRSLKAVPNNDYNEQPIRMVMAGPFGGYYNFLKDVEALPRITRISEMSLNKDPKSEGQVTAELTLTIFFDSSARQKQVAEAP